MGEATKENIKNKAPSGRPQRKPIGTSNRMKIRNRDDVNFFYRWVNDVDDRVEMFKEGGYQVVDPQDAQLEQSRIEGGLSADKTLSVGGGIRAVLMRQRKEDYDEDQNTKKEAITATLTAITNPSLDGKYGNIQIK